MALSRHRLNLIAHFVVVVVVVVAAVVVVVVVEIRVHLRTGLLLIYYWRQLRGFDGINSIDRNDPGD